MAKQELAPSLADLDREDFQVEPKTGEEIPDEKDDLEQDDPKPDPDPDNKGGKDDPKEKDNLDSDDKPDNELVDEKDKGGDDDPDNPDDPDDQDDEGSIYIDINNQLGFEPEEEFEDTPEGYAKYTRSYGEHMIRGMEEMLQKKYPKAYSYLVHQMNGGKDNEFFQSDSTENWDFELKEDDAETQKNVVSQSLKKEGWSDKKIGKWIEQLEEDDELFGEAKERLERHQNSAKEAEARKQQEILERNEQRKKQVENMTGNIVELVNGGKIKSIDIPEKEKTDFNKYIMQNISFSDGKFFIRREISKDNLEDELHNEFFRFRKGDLGDLIERKAKTQSVRRLKKDISKTGRKKSSTKKETGNITTLSDIM